VTILDNHTPLVTILSPSILNIVYINENGDKTEKDFAI
jgi:F0F1-type ATP synthase epsilon subunit